MVPPFPAETTPLRRLKKIGLKEIGAAILPAAVLLVLFLGAAQAEMPPGAERAWKALAAGGHVVLLRHATAPGVGDPPGFRLEDCGTQRNLSEAGRAQARRIGARFRERAVVVGKILSSRWCRALETARLLDLGPVEPTPALDSVFGWSSREAEQTQAVRDIVARWRGDTLVLVTHQVNITALTGMDPASGEMVVLRPGGPAGFELVGRLPPG